MLTATSQTRSVVAGMYFLLKLQRELDIPNAALYCEISTNTAPYTCV